MKSIFEKFKVSPADIEALMREATIYAERLRIERLADSASRQRQDAETQAAEAIRQVPKHQVAIRSALIEILQHMDDADPVVTMFATTITCDGRVQVFNHGAIEPDTATHAVNCLVEATHQRIRAMMLGGKSPLITRFPHGGEK